MVFWGQKLFKQADFENGIVHPAKREVSKQDGKKHNPAKII
jgi:hypothetical protein